MYGGGIGSLTVSSRNAAGDDAPWVPVWTKEGNQGDSWQATTIYSASGSYYKVTATRGGGIRGDIAIDNMNLVACTPAPTLAPTNAGELPICDFTAGFCDWTQDTGDNFDWALTSEGTPTSNTGPSDGAGHGGGAFIHIEANDQAEGAYAAITSSATGCGLYIDYHMYGGGIGSLTVSTKDVAEGDDAAWVPVWTKEGDQGDSWQAATIYSVSGSYYRVMATRGGGIRGDIAVDNLNMIWCSPAPTTAPTNVGDTHVPTISPTAAPTAAPTSSPQYMLAAIGTCSLPYTFIDTAAACSAAAAVLSLADITAAVTNTPTHPYGCYYKQSSPAGYNLWFNHGGNMEDDDPDRVSICKLTTTAPTATPTNTGDTNAPTVAPTPTVAPSWIQLQNECESSSLQLVSQAHYNCDTANGGCTITLSEDFVMGSYSGEIEFSGKAITIWGQGKVLDASGGGRFFKAIGAGSFLELHDVVLQNGNAENVSGWSASRHAVVDLF
jgi:hypothetical protein